MSEQHDNSRPASSGTFSVSGSGVIHVFPIEKAEKLKPQYTLYLIEKTDGSLTASFDMKISPDLYDE
jgi:hypothetical protein